MTPQAASSTVGKSLRGQIGLFVLTRLLINTTFRMLYPFLPVFARGLGIGLGELSGVLSLRSLLGAAAAPLIAPLAESRGRKISMLAGVGLFVLGCGLVAAWPVWPTFVAVLLLAQFSNMAFLPAMQAYLGDRVPFRERGQVMAVTELSWSLSFILGVPLVGVLIARFGWPVVFPLLAGVGLLCWAALLRWVPADHPIPPASGSPAAARLTAGSFLRGLGVVLASPSARAALGVSLLITIANEVVNLVFGVWMEDTFGLKIAALGAASLLIGLAELAGEGGTVLLVDRLGKARTVRLGLILGGLASLLLPWLGHSLSGALVGLFLFYLTFEFCVVSFIPLLSEVLPQARALMMAYNLSAFMLGRAIGSLAGGWLYPLGIGANAALAVLMYLSAIWLLGRVRLPEEHAPA